MAKKRQQDFVKTQLKPGRTLSRRKNVTPHVKAKKLILPKKSDGSPKSISTILESLKSPKSGSHRLTSLQQLEGRIDSKQLTFFVPEIFESVTDFILEPDSDLRNAAVKVLKKIFEKKNSETLKMKILSLHPLLIKTLKCGMSHPAARVKGSTLVLLSIILEHYPDLICNSLDIFKSFEHLILAQIRKLSHQHSTKSNSVSAILHDGLINIENYKIQVFDTLKLFLKEMLKNLETDIVEEDNDEQDVYWNCEGPLHLEIYAGGGLKPVDIEKSAVDRFSSQMLNFDDPSIFHDHIKLIITGICETFLEEIPSQIKADDSHLQNKTIQNVNILLQVLCQLTELIQLIPCDTLDEEIRNFLLHYIYKRNLFPFHPSGVFDSNQRSEATELNLAVCFLHSKFLLQAECGKDEYNDSVITYIKNVFHMSYEIRKNSIPMLVKILKTYYSLTHLDQISDFIVDTLGHMSSLLKIAVGRPNRYPNKHVNKDVNKDVLISLFMKFSLHPAYDFLIETVAMKNWFNWLLTQLTDIPNSGIVNKNLLRITKKVANRKYPFFLKALSRIDDNKYKALLKYDNPDVRDTVIFLVYNMQSISGSLLEDISNVILLDTSFPMQYAIRLIRLLTCRFTEKHQNNDTDIKAFRRAQTDFIQFLFNIAIDSLNLTTEKWFDYDANEYVKAMEPFKDVASYNIFPSLHWKEHAKLFEVCHKSLSLLPQKLVNSIAMLLFKEVLDHTRNLPMHSTIAILKLINWEIKDRHHRFQLDDLIFSSLLTTSVLTHMTTEDEWYQYNVVELMDSMELSRRIAVETLQRQLENMDDLNGIAMYHILRICKFYLDRGLFKSEDGERVLNILEGFKGGEKNRCSKDQELFVFLKYLKLYVT